MRCSPGSTLKKNKGQPSDACASHHHAISGLASATPPGLGPIVPQPGLCPFSADEPRQPERHCSFYDPEWPTTRLLLEHVCVPLLRDTCYRLL
jgi:hypothetical protein